MTGFVDQGHIYFNETRFLQIYNTIQYNIHS